MLYDNAQLARVYLHAWQVTGNELFRTVTEEILDYVVREMLDESGGFYSTQDADSEGEKGKCFFWTPDEIRALLRSEADAFMAAYGVTRHGNASTGSAHGFEGKNILEFVGGMEQCPALTEAYRKLFEAREKRVHPGRDEQVLASWNGLMPAAVGEAASTLNREGYGSKGEGDMAGTAVDKGSGDAPPVRRRGICISIRNEWVVQPRGTRCQRLLGRRGKANQAAP